MIALSKRRPRRSTRKKQSLRNKQSLRFTPTAWAKLLFLRDVGGTEVGMFGLSHPDDLLLIESVVMVQQLCTPVTVEFDDSSVADYFDDQIDLGRTPEQCGRIWLHTHPGSCPNPSGTDEETFDRVFGSTDWAVMFILAQEGETYCRLRYNVGPGSNKRLNVAVDYDIEFGESDHNEWLAEYEASVQVLDPLGSRPMFDERFDNWAETQWVAS